MSETKKKMEEEGFVPPKPPKKPNTNETGYVPPDPPKPLKKPSDEKK
jgi:hypothetical protein